MTTYPARGGFSSADISSPILDDSVFTPGAGGSTKVLTLSNKRDLRLTPNATPAVSRSGTIGSRQDERDERPNFSIGSPTIPEEDGAAQYSLNDSAALVRGPSLPASPRPPKPPASPNPASDTADKGLGFIKPPENAGGFFKRRMTRRSRDKTPPSPSSETELEYEERAVNGASSSSVNESAEGPRRDEDWIDILTRSNGHRAPNQDFETRPHSAVPSTMSVGTAGHDPPVPTFHVRSPTADNLAEIDQRTLPRPPRVSEDAESSGHLTEQARSSEDDHESPYDGISEAEDTNEGSDLGSPVWRGSRVPDGAVPMATPIAYPDDEMFRPPSMAAAADVEADEQDERETIPVVPSKDDDSLRDDARSVTVICHPK